MNFLVSDSKICFYRENEKKVRVVEIGGSPFRENALEREVEVPCCIANQQFQKSGEREMPIFVTDCGGLLILDVSRTAIDFKVLPPNLKIGKIVKVANFLQRDGIAMFVENSEEELYYLRWYTSFNSVLGYCWKTCQIKGLTCKSGKPIIGMQDVVSIGSGGYKDTFVILDSGGTSWISNRKMQFTPAFEKIPEFINGKKPPKKIRPKSNNNCYRPLTHLNHLRHTIFNIKKIFLPSGTEEDPTAVCLTRAGMLFELGKDAGVRSINGDVDFYEIPIFLHVPRSCQILIVARGIPNQIHYLSRDAQRNT